MHQEEVGVRGPWREVHYQVIIYQRQSRLFIEKTEFVHS